MTLNIPDWVPDAIFYQIFPDRFAKSERVPKPANLQPWGASPTYNAFQGGDLLGVIEKLDHLVDLGVNAIYFNPIFSSASNHRYHTHDYFQIDPILGGNAVFKELITEAHKRDIRVILDGVFNHASRGFFQFNHLLECRQESPYTDWFHLRGWPVNAYQEHEAANYSAWWGLHALPKFNTDTPAVREFLWQVGTYWLEQGIDGWRLDVPNEIDDDEFWREFRRRCRAVNPDCYIVGELWEEAGRWLQGDQFDAQMNYLFTRATLGYFIGRKLNRDEIQNTGYGKINNLNGLEFAAELERIFNQMYHPDIVLAQMNMLGSHDTPRLKTLANDNLDVVRLMYLCQMTSPGAPNIYYGDEIGLDGHHDPDNRRAFPWDDKEKWHQGFLKDLKSYIQLRHDTPALRRGTFQIILATPHIVVYQRKYKGQRAVIAFNISAKKQSFTWPNTLPIAREKLIANGFSATPGTTINLPPMSGRVWVADQS